MGMDVYGLAPKSEQGEYFRNNVWWWRPLWDYCCEVVPELESLVPDGHSNSGDGLTDEQDCELLANKIIAEIESGRTQEYAEMRQAYLDALPLENCRICEGTGQRPDGYFGVEWTKDGCNGCEGTGKVRNFSTNYPFSVENVQEFTVFLLNCGGFEIC